MTTRRAVAVLKLIAALDVLVKKRPPGECESWHKLDYKGGILTIRCQRADGHSTVAHVHDDGKIRRYW